MTNRPLTPEELEIVNKRKGAFEEFYNGMIPALVSFMRSLKIEPTHEVLHHAEAFLPKVCDALGELKLDGQQDPKSLIAWIAAYVGEYFAQKYSGCWFVNEIGGSRFFGQYVVGQFGRAENKAAMVDPFLVARELLGTPQMPLAKFVAEIEKELSAK